MQKYLIIKGILNSIIQLIFARRVHHFDELVSTRVFCVISIEIGNGVTRIISNKLIPIMKIADLIQLQTEDLNISHHNQTMMAFFESVTSSLESTWS